MTGVVCPECGGESEVKDSRSHKNGIRRRRICDQGHRFSTLESVVDMSRKAAPPKKPRRINPIDLPLTYLSLAQKARARQLFQAGWKPFEVAPLFDMTTQELKK